MDERVRDIMARPYLRAIQPDDGSWFGQVLELPGCFALGNTPEEAISNLSEVMESWLLSSIEQGQDVPDPFEAESGSVGRAIRRAMGRSEFARVSPSPDNPAK